MNRDKIDDSRDRVDDKVDGSRDRVDDSRDKVDDSRDRVDDSRDKIDQNRDIQKNMLDRIRNAFNYTENSCIYGREKEIKKIKEFLESKETVLHITGNPGTGKTAAVRYALRNEDYEYLNYYFSPNVYKRIKGTDKKIVIIDEYDKFASEKKTECRKTLSVMRMHRQRLITIGNDLKVTNVEFLPYDRDEIYRIIEKKIGEEIGVRIMSDELLMIISRKFESTGSMRDCFKFILGCYERKGCSANHKEDNSVDKWWYLNKSDIVWKMLPIENVRNMQHEMIKAVLSENTGYSKCYEAYLDKCKQLEIPVMDRSDFQTLYDLSI